MSTASETRALRSRRSARPSGDDREQAILATAERLLERRPFAEISVDDLAKGAGISRPTFYFYFGSKEAVLLTLWERVIREADAALEAAASTTTSEDVWRPGITVFFDTFGAHRGVTVAASSSDNAEIRDVFAKFMQKWIDFTAATIEAERRRGAAPETLPAHDLATALNLMNERTLLAAFAAENPGIPAERVLDSLVHVWTCAVYGECR
ncbi:TetR/AcrR family transcriptional regulator [Mycolicibacterium litorale]|uniref:HTH-type transcriptional regulator EthR n=1 Tax=Mycolicibacterium litorale TaxID=758802 RepID=A0AAD1MWK3_9MYCO|nr:TetR/AcrR family transcriptional regulator [Mycolicibacterium litorale]MCV7417698.1 TetR/AcrR family transcriptional regulator [Mycolicibacterium litorale]TDY06913.1 TetR family transcriptional regulator [Mycolicibacterium litorale]BBY18928.1 HTH-type transcriptional regulator EthR [Mycolicibacterium litorale]